VIHPTADVSPEAVIGERTRIWHRAQIRENARIGSECIIGKDVYVDREVVIGSRVKIQNGALVYRGATIEDGVFIGPQVIVANDHMPRAITPEGRLKGEGDWTAGRVQVCYGASLGAGAIILPGVTIGRFALVGAGAVVTRSVPPHGIALGNPARHAGYVCPTGHVLEAGDRRHFCAACRWELPTETVSPAVETSPRGDEDRGRSS
jgi:acetyltransferase-like isoleucine patch superfamily enzyme